MDDGGDTQVAGTVIERSEPPLATEEPSETQITPARLRPLPERTPPPPPAAPVDNTVVAPAPEEPAGPVGLIRDPEPEPTREPRDRDRDPEPTPRPEPTREPEPEPEPTQEPEDPASYALRNGEGLSRDTAESMESGDSGQWQWQIKSLAGHENQDEQTQRSRKAMARLEVGFNEEAKRSSKQVRDFRCDAVLSAGSRRLTTDDDHVFVISLWTSDGYSPQNNVGSVIIKQVVDLDPGETQTLYSNVYTLDAADQTSYTCRVRYREA